VRLTVSSLDHVRLNIYADLEENAIAHYKHQAMFSLDFVRELRFAISVERNGKMK
jgi:hypothetical protein